MKRVRVRMSQFPNTFLMLVADRQTNKHFDMDAVFTPTSPTSQNPDTN